MVAWPDGQARHVQKRRVLRFSEAKRIFQIDTVEPEGGSAEPSGKPLLFTYLRLDPNHP
jgi:hypothetical protein